MNYTAVAEVIIMQIINYQSLDEGEHDSKNSVHAASRLRGTGKFHQPLLAKLSPHKNVKKT